MFRVPSILELLATILELLATILVTVVSVLFEERNRTEHVCYCSVLFHEVTRTGRTENYGLKIFRGNFDLKKIIGKIFRFFRFESWKNYFLFCSCSGDFFLFLFQSVPVLRKCGTQTTLVNSQFDP